MVVRVRNSVIELSDRRSQLEFEVQRGSAAKAAFSPWSVPARDEAWLRYEAIVKMEAAGGLQIISSLSGQPGVPATVAGLGQDSVSGATRYRAASVPR